MLCYNGQPIEITVGYKVSLASFECSRRVPIDGVAWHVFDGFEDYITDDVVYPTEKDAMSGAKKKITALQEADKRENEIYMKQRILSSKTFITLQAAMDAGCNMPVEYYCYECGMVFFAEWRSNFSTNPECPLCGEDLMLDYKIVDK